MSDVLKLIRVQQLMLSGSTKHERDVAGTIFKEMLKKRGITEAEFNSTIKNEQKKIYYFKYKTKHEKKLLMHVIAKILNCSDFPVYYRKGKKNAWGFNLTLQQKTDAEHMYEIYRRALNDEIDNLVLAFLITNDIFAESSSTPTAEFSEKELLRRQKARKMAARLDVIEIKKGLNNG